MLEQRYKGDGTEQPTHDVVDFHNVTRPESTTYDDNDIKVD